VITAASPISIVIADDHPVVLHGAIALLNSHQDLRVVAVCRDGIEARDAIRKLAPDIAVLDIAMPGLSGLDVLAAIGAERLDTKTVLLTVSAADSQVLTAIAGGARAILLKDAAPDDLIRCIREVAAGRYWLPTDTVERALERETGRRIEATRVVGALTRRERQVMLLVSEGNSNKEVGRHLSMSEGTVKIHLHNIYQKIGARNRTILTMLAAAYRDQLVSAIDAGDSAKRTS
jgi:DNA-binding NarL/FixJ family response regulator